MSKNCVEAKIAQWTQLQAIAFELDSRNHNFLGVATLVPTALTLASILFNEHNYENTEILSVINVVFPAMLLAAFFFGTYNSKHSAILRGYIGALEESINRDLSENVFLWNKGYSELFHNRFFVTNDASFVLSGVCAVVIPMYNYHYMFANSDLKILVLLYAIVYYALILVFGYDLMRCAKTKKYAMIYYFLINYPEDRSWTSRFDKADIKLIRKTLKMSRKKVKS